MTKPDRVRLQVVHGAKVMGKAVGESGVIIRMACRLERHWRWLYLLCALLLISSPQALW